MITFEDVRHGAVSHFYLPEELKNDIVPYLRKAHIDFHAVPWRQIRQNALYNEDIDEARRVYADLGYPDTYAVGCIVSDICPEDLFEKSKLFFGDAVDKDHAKEQRRLRQAAYNMSCETVLLYNKDHGKPYMNLPSVPEGLHPYRVPESLRAYVGEGV